MLGPLFWMGTGAALGLWGRRKMIDTVEQYVPPKVVNAVQKKVNATVQNFAADVVKAQAEAKRTARATGSVVENRWQTAANKRRQDSEDSENSNN